MRLIAEAYEKRRTKLYIAFGGAMMCMFLYSLEFKRSTYPPFSCPCLQDGTKSLCCAEPFLPMLVWLLLLLFVSNCSFISIENDCGVCLLNVPLSWPWSRLAGGVGGLTVCADLSVTASRVNGDVSGICRCCVSSSDTLLMATLLSNFTVSDMILGSFVTSRILCRTSYGSSSPRLITMSLQRMPSIPVIASSKKTASTSPVLSLIVALTRYLCK